MTAGALLKLFWRCRVFAASVVVLSAPAAAARDERVSLLPRLREGQTIVYQIRYRAERQTKTESRVVAPIATPSGDTDFVRTVRLDVVQVLPAGDQTKLVLRTQIQEPDKPFSEANAKVLDFTLSANGTATDIKGMESLSQDDQAAWRDWVARFAAAWTFPARLKPGEKWTSEEGIAGSVLAGLVWEKESQYVREEPCPVGSFEAARDQHQAANFPRESCAVILSKSILKQKSSAKDATPEDYKLHDLKTAGTARGENEVISYISLKTGLVVRVSEQATQSMDVVIAKSDGSNRVHYNIDAKSHAEVLLVATRAAVER